MTARRWLLILLAFLALSNAAVFGVRLQSLHLTSQWIPQLGDAISVYALWRLRHGHALYESLTRPYFSFTPYNFLFYRVYEGLASLTRDDRALLWTARLPTSAFALLGALAQYRTVALVAGRPFGPFARWVNRLLAFNAWFGCGIVSWWALAIRPDVGAAALATVGLYAAIAAVWYKRYALDAAAGIAFAAAWGFKQSYVMFFVAAVAHAVFRRRSWRAAAFIGAPFTAVASAALLFGSPEYRYDLLVAQTLDRIRPYDVQFWLRGDLFPGLLIWTLPAWSVVEFARRSGRGVWHAVAHLPESASAAAGADLRLIVLAALLSGAWVVATIGKIGSSNNYAIEPAAAFSVWCGVVLARYASRADPDSNRALMASSWMVVPMVLFVGGVLAGGDYALSHAVGLRARSETLTLGAPGELERRRQIEAKMQALAIPIYIRDEPLSLPWHTNDNHYPAVVIDHVLFDPAEAKGLVQVGLPGLVRARYFGSLLLTPDDPLGVAAARAGYRRLESVPAPYGGVLEIYAR